MIGLTRFTEALSGDPIWINPIQITMFTPTTPQILIMLGQHTGAIVPNSTIILVGALVFQIRETPGEVIAALARLKAKHEDALSTFRKRIQDEDEWWKKGPPDEDPTEI